MSAPIASQGKDEQTEAKRAVESRWLPSGAAYIRVSTLSRGSDEDLVGEFDVALDALFDAPGLILDLRVNGGGDSRIGDRIAGRLMDRWFLYGWESYRLPLP